MVNLCSAMSVGPSGLIFDCLLYLHPWNGKKHVPEKEEKQTIFVMSHASASEFQHVT